MSVKGVLFDVDDTLFDYSGSEEAGLLGQLRAQPQPARFPDDASVLVAWREIMTVYYSRFLAGELTFTEQQRARTKTFLGRLGHRDVTDEQARAWFAGYEAHRDTAWAAFPDAEPAVRELAVGYRLGIVSNSDANHQRRKLQSIGLLPYFGTAVTCSGEHGAPKPAVSIFLAGCAALGLAPSEVAYVGDNYPVDAEGAHAAGLHAYWLHRNGVRTATGADTGREVRPGIAVIQSLAELPAALSACG